MKPRVGVSACLLGQAVRYDGASRPQAWIRDQLPRYAEIRPFCPEIGAGLAVPRPAVQLVRGDDARIHARCVEDPRLDVTDVLHQWAAMQAGELQVLDGIIFKSRSPSCGLGTTPLFNEKAALLKTNFDGIFAAWVKTNYPELVLCDEVCVEDKQGQELFLARILKEW